MALNIEKLLGAEAKPLLTHKCTTIPKESLHLPGPDFVDRVFALSDRPTPVLKSLQGALRPRPAGRHRLPLDPAVDQGIEHSAGASSRPTRSTSTPRTS